MRNVVYEKIFWLNFVIFVNTMNNVEDNEMGFKIISKYLETEDSPSYKVKDESGLLYMMKIIEDNEDMKDNNLMKCTIHKLKNESKKVIKSEWCSEMNLLMLNNDKLEYILNSILNALNELNSNNAYHGKLYPSNILKNEKNEVILVDYYQDKLINPLKNMNINNIRFLSPEHFQSGKISIKSDIFSFGSILYTLLSNENCFVGKNKDDIKTKILNCEYYPFDEIEVEDDKEKEVIVSVNKLLKQIFVKNAEERIDLDKLKVEIDNLLKLEIEKFLPLKTISSEDDNSDENEIKDNYCSCGKSDHKTLYPLHEMIYQNCSLNKIKKYIYTNGLECIESVDCGGNTPLMVSMKLKRIAVAKYLLKIGANPNVKDGDNWHLDFFACGINDYDLMSLYLEKKMIGSEEKLKRKIEGIAKSLKDSPNGHIRLKYAFYTWIVILNGLLPQDTVDIYKQDDNMRIDFTIDGIDGMSITRGHISLLFIGNSDKEGVESELYQINHKKKTYEAVSFDMSSSSSSKNKSNGEIEPQLIDMTLKTPRFYMDLYTRDATFKPTLTYLHNEKKGKVKEWNTEYYDMYNIKITTFIGKPASDEPLILPNGEHANQPYDLIGLMGDDKNCSTIKIQPNKSEEIVINCKQGTEVDFEFNEINNRNITFVLEFHASINGKVYENERVNTVSHKSRMEAQEDGVLHLIWINDRKFHFFGKEKEVKVSVNISGKNEVNSSFGDLDIGVGCLNRKVREINSDVKKVKFTINAQLQMSQEFPFSIEDIFPIAQVLAKSVRHFENFTNFFKADNFPKGFPVYCDLPLKYTLSFYYKMVEAEKKEMDKELFKIPEGYKLVDEEEEKNKDKEENKEKEGEKEVEKKDEKI